VANAERLRRNSNVEKEICSSVEKRQRQQCGEEVDQTYLGGAALGR